MLTAAPGSWFSWDYTIYEGPDAVARLDLAWVREAGELSIRGEAYRVYREHLCGGAFILEREGRVLARAEKPSALFRSFAVACEGRSYVWEAESAWLRRFALREGGRTVGSMAPEHPFTRRAAIDLPEDIPLPIRIFLAWLAIILWKRDANNGPE